MERIYANAAEPTEDGTVNSAIFDPMEAVVQAARDRAPSRALVDVTVRAAMRLEQDQLDAVRALAIPLTQRLREQAEL